MAATSQLSAHWGNILAVLDGLLATLRANHCPAFLVRKLFQQLFSFVNVQARPGPAHPSGVACSTAVLMPFCRQLVSLVLAGAIGC